MKIAARQARRVIGLVIATLFVITLLAACEVYPAKWTSTFVVQPKNTNPAPTLDQHLSTGWKIAATVSPFGSSGGIGYFFTRPVDLPEGAYPSAWEQKMVFKPKSVNPEGVLSAEEPDGWELSAAVSVIGNSKDVGYFLKRPLVGPSYYPTKWQHTFFLKPKTFNPAVSIAEQEEQGWELVAAVGPLGSSSEVGYFFKRAIPEEE